VSLAAGFCFTCLKLCDEQLVHLLPSRHRTFFPQKYIVWRYTIHGVRKRSSDIGLFSFDGNAHVISLCPSSHIGKKAIAYVWRFHGSSLSIDIVTKGVLMNKGNELCTLKSAMGNFGTVSFFCKIPFTIPKMRQKSCANDAICVKYL